jgi:hypothetical protein
VEVEAVVDADAVVEVEFLVDLIQLSNSMTMAHLMVKQILPMTK